MPIDNVNSKSSEEKITTKDGLTGMEIDFPDLLKKGEDEEESDASFDIPNFLR